VGYGLWAAASFYGRWRHVFCSVCGCVTARGDLLCSTRRFCCGRNIYCSPGFLCLTAPHPRSSSTGLGLDGAAEYCILSPGNGSLWN
jgi:hypothetical protein